MRTIVTGALLALGLGCSSSSSGSGAKSEAANPCATKGASYLETSTEMSGGTCGPISSQVVNVDDNGNIQTSTTISCAEVEQDGCTARDTDCTFSSQGISFTETLEVTFASDGSSATGLVTISATGGQACASTYAVTLTRQ